MIYINGTLKLKNQNGDEIPKATTTAAGICFRCQAWGFDMNPI